MMQAKPTQEEMDAMWAFMQSLSDLVNDDEVPEGIHDEWPKVSHCWQRVLSAGQTCIENACDPDADVLKFKPSIIQAMNEAERKCP